MTLLVCPLPELMGIVSGLHWGLHLQPRVFIFSLPVFLLEMAQNGPDRVQLLTAGRAVPTAVRGTSR